MSTTEEKDKNHDDFLTKKALQRFIRAKQLGQTNSDGNSDNNSDLKAKDDHESFENMLRLDRSDIESAENEMESERRLLNKLVDSSDAEGNEEIDVDMETQNTNTSKPSSSAGRQDDEQTSSNYADQSSGKDIERSSSVDIPKSSNGGSLLASLNSDVEKYHKKVQLKRKVEKKVFEKEKQITHELEKEREKMAENGTGFIIRRPKTSSDSEFLDSESYSSEKRPLSFDESTETPEKKQKISLPVGKKVFAWTKAEDDAIVYYKEEMKYSWKKIETLLDGRHSWQAIQMRYLRNHKSRNDEWSRFMEIKLINAIRKDWEGRWKRIGQDLGRDFGSERCITKNIEICKKMEMPYFSSVFENKEITAGYKNPFNDIKDSEAHKKLMLVYMGLDSISYEDSDEETKENS